jgi:hypothetical protein
MKPLYFFILCLSASVLSCSKEKTPVNAVYIRIQNSTSTAFENAIKNDVPYGSIAKGSTTNYQLFKNPVVAFPGALIYKTKNDSAYAGVFYCGTPPLPYLENGRYTLVIKDGVANINPDFTAEFIKD